MYPAARYFREFILVAVFSRLDDHHPSYLDPRGKSAKPRKMPTPRKYWPPSPSLFMPKTVGNTAPFLPLGEGGGAIVEKSWKNSFWNERIFGGEVFQASRATLTTRCCNVMV